jgi:hypothetical protein
MLKNHSFIINITHIIYSIANHTTITTSTNFP